MGQLAADNEEGGDQRGDNGRAILRTLAGHADSCLAALRFMVSLIVLFEPFDPFLLTLFMP